MCVNDQEAHESAPALTEEQRITLTRRGALRAATVAAAAGAVGAAGGLAAASPASAGGRGGTSHGRVPRDQISVQLYTLRDQLAADLPGTLRALADIGYTRVEHAGFVGRTAAQFKAALDAVGLRATSGHVGIPQPFDAASWQAALADARLLRQRYIVHPFFGVGANGVIRDSATYRAFARDLNKAGALAKKAGLRFGYHNHHFEFFRLDGGTTTGWDILTGETDPDLVHLEVDLFWVTRGAHDPVDVIRANRGRIKQFHVKDLGDSGSFADVGDGLIDFARIFQHGREAGIDEYIVERDDAGTSPRTPAQAIDTARVGYNYLANLRF
ncbi:xylose isomerase [Asanoa ishikariensis]|uniref:Sugar phosphate isomerase/epimerase n=1 Tax=Asanoa ishikariensis TaxID=137265 RepID=A0A1H3MYE8_9ACTN|nr:sugar phosphate isomerase/epimerase [Asanoa ishikariensis]GIF68968.1 xylose isomerase [Asanoa ishikariensis]SDY81672.1 Sugar phosphate isomerase/epimerase [Asanoa ishikariensis]